MYYQNLNKNAMQERLKIQANFLDEKFEFPLVLTPQTEGESLLDYISSDSSFFKDSLSKYGALLFRGFKKFEVEELEKITTSIMGELINYVDRGSIRSKIKNNIFTSSDADGQYNITMHCESSFTNRWPSRIFFYCETPVAIGGETPIADVSRVYDRIPKNIINDFIEKKILYVRNFKVSSAWRYVFQVESESEMEDFARKNQIELIWKIKGESCQTRQIRPAIIKHPVTENFVWFNQVDNFYSKIPEDKLLDPLYSHMEEQWFSAYFGNGDIIPESYIQEIKMAYDKEILAFPWEKNDLLILDNMWIAHGRRAFQGERKILTGMADPVTWNNVNI